MTARPAERDVPVWVARSILERVGPDTSLDDVASELVEWVELQAMAREVEASR